ncbi:hypothetical protein L873DRAFT_1818995 [Choiromyces venosus 120613-1]|uniref:Uncharacterized protein n=1 Tax=Choiromyces venosus 120613-1 TaxID=1336337 RepID=A0A3N4J0N8_9PEZI|nr:hypothetical protein L873DRAFT_1818995 [Choiromyces venosus 120613-1]
MSLDGNYAAGVDSFEFSTSEAPETIRSDSEVLLIPSSSSPSSMLFLLFCLIAGEEEKKNLLTNFLEPEEPFSNNGSLTYRRDFSMNALLMRLGRRDLIATPVPWDIAARTSNVLNGSSGWIATRSSVQAYIPSLSSIPEC